MTQDSAISERFVPHRLAATIVRAAAVWILLGGVLKLFWGTPNDLPDVVRDMMWRDPAAWLALVVGVELLIGIAAMISPRLGWWGVAALLAVFTGVAVIETARGSESCGCFGAAVTVPPWVMAAIDVLILAAVLWARPWSSLRNGAWRPWWCIGTGLAAFTFAFLLINEEGDAPDSPTNPLAVSTLPANGVLSPPNGSNFPPDNGSNVADDGGEVPTVPDTPEWRLPDRLPRWVELRPQDWVGHDLRATQLAIWTDVSKIPDNSLLVFYYDTCPHCRDLLRQLAANPMGENYVMLRFPPVRGYPVVVDQRPQGLLVDLPKGTQWVIEVPWKVTVRGGRVERAEYLGK